MSRVDEVKIGKIRHIVSQQTPEESFENHKATMHEEHTWEDATKLRQWLDGEPGVGVTDFYHGGRRIEQIRHDVLVGTPEIAAKIDEVASKAPPVVDLAVMHQKRRRRRVWSDDGDEYSKERMLAGHTDTWRKRMRMNVDSPRVVNVWAYRGGNAGRSPQQLLEQGAAAVAMIRRIEEAGYGVNFWSITCSSVYSYVGSNVVQLKSADQYTNPNVMMGVMCDANYFRTMDFFRFTELYPHNSGLGSAAPEKLRLAQYQAELAKLGIGKPDIVLGGYYTLDDAMRQAKKALDKISNGGQ